MSKKITSEGNGYLSLWMVATTGEDAHDDIPQVQIKIGGNEIYNNKPLKASGQLLVFNECATEVYTDPKTMPKTQKPDVTALITELVNSRTKINVSAPVKIKDDYKAGILEASRNVNTIVDQIINSIQSTGTIKKAKAYIITPEFRRYLTTSYRDIYGNLIQYRLLKDGDNYQFDENNTNKGRKGDMFGDMRKRMDEFYNKFEAVYKDSSDNWIIKGVSTMELINTLTEKGFLSLT
jgi:hypothetical protein